MLATLNQSATDLGILKRQHALGYARPYRGQLAIVACLMLGEAGVTLAVPWLAGQLAGGFLEGGGLPLGRLALVLVAMLAVIGIIRFAATLISGTISTRILADLRLLAHDHLQALPLSFHQARQQGDLLAVTTWEIGRLSGFLTGTLVSIPPLILTTVGAIILMARIDPVLALIVPVMVPAFYLALKVVGRRLRALGVQVQQADAALMAAAEEDLAMLPAIKSFTREGPASARYRDRIGHLRDLSIQEIRIYAALDPVVQFIAATGAVLILWLAGQSLQAGQMTPAELFSFLLYAALLTRPVAALANLYGRIQSTRGTLARLGDVLATPPEPGSGAPIRIERAQGEIRFEQVHFAYPARPAALHGVNLTIVAGETVALTGANGAGKSTLVALLMRLHDPDSGRILIDGQDITQIALRDLRRQIGFVPQRALLFNATLRENIGFGLTGASQDQIEVAARRAQAHDFILTLPQGYDTLIGDHGVRLSGGQGQRVALARALLKDPPILILDEATSMYDLDGESAFVEAAAAALHDRTVILITHRPATLALANRVIALEKGKIT